MPYRKYLPVVLVLLWGCSTKKNTWLSRNFHNTTAHYNVYFNGNESFKAGIKEIEDGYKDNYIKVLPMFEESDEAAASVASSSMDRAIDKGTKLIVRHSITARPKKKSGSKKDIKNRKEYNKWVDDALLMIGKAQIVKHEFRQAIRTLDLLIRDFSYEESKYSALIWKARAYTELEDYNNARIALESYDYDGNAPAQLYGDYMEVYANLLLVQERYKEAIPFLQHAIDGADNRTERARYSFILGQIKQLTGDDAGAAIAYSQTLKCRPGYEMAFNAQIKRATILYKDASLDVIKKQIKKMLRDKKNEDFRDQIYYALGKTYLNFEDEPEAIKSFKKSTEVSVDNDYQKTLSYLSIADIYFDKEIYKPAYQHYDSAMTVMSEDFKDYQLINEKRNSLQLLVEQLDIINNEDSLIMLADMTESERNKFIDDIIETEKKRIKEEEKLKSREGDEYYGGGGSYQSSGQQAGGGGKWYFYNVTTKELGKQEFTRKWGKRKLTDDWRRKEKGMVEMSQNEPGEPGEPGEPFGDNPQQTSKKGGNKTETPDSTSTQQTNKVPTKESLLANIPLTDESYREAQFTRDISKFDAGMIYLERLKNYPRAIEMFEDCLISSTIPEKDKEAIYISLYKAYEASGDNVNMQRTLSNLKKSFPDSRFVQYIEDPNYLAKIETAKKLVDDEYAETYTNYLTGRYDTVIVKATDIELNDTANIYLPKYRLIKALSYARKGETDLFKQNLETITTKHPDTEEADYALLFIEQLDKGRSPVKSPEPYNSILTQRLTNMSSSKNKQQTDAKPDMTGFIYAENESHSFMALPPAGADINRMIFNLADFNFSRYLIDDYGIETTLLPDNSQVILIKGFKNKLEGMDYFYSVRENEDKLFGSDSVKTKLFSISETNLKFFLSSGQINNYDAFFSKLYLKPVNIEELPEEMLPKTAKKIAKPVTPETVADSTTVETNITETDSTAIPPPPATVSPKDTAKVTETANTVVKEQKGEVKPDQPVKQQETKTAVAAVATSEKPTPEPQPKDTVPTASTWIFNAESQQDVVVVFKKSRIDYNKILKIYTNYTKNIYKNDNLKVEMDDFSEEFKIISVTGFKNIKQAKEFRDGLGTKSFLMRDIKNREYYIWVITPQNRATLKQNKDMKGYNAFFKEKYR